MGSVSECDRGTGWYYCPNAEPLTPCRCDCVCLDQRHCPKMTEDDHG